jgi:hypothetical protein
MSSYNFLDMLRELSTASTDKAKKSFNLQFEAVWGGQGSFAGISFDRYLPTAIVFVSFLVTFNFFRLHNVLLLPSNPVCRSLALSQVFLQQNERVFQRKRSEPSGFYAARFVFILCIVVREPPQGCVGRPGTS